MNKFIKKVFILAIIFFLILQSIPLQSAFAEESVVLQPGESVQITGAGDISVSRYGRHNYVVYNSDGATRYGSSSYGHYIDGQSRMVLENTDDEEITVSAESGVVERIQAPAFKTVSVKEGDTWEYRGDSDFTIPSYYEYVDYRTDGTARTYSSRASSIRLTTLNEEVERRVITMQQDQEVYGPYETFVVPEKISGPAIKRVTVEDGETWAYKGDSDFTISSYYEYVDYRAGGTARSYNSRALNNRLTTLNEEVERRVITMQQDQVVYGPNETFMLPEKTSGPAIKRVTVEDGETWAYKGDSDFTIPGYYEYVDYKEDGTARSYSRASLSDRLTTLNEEVERRVITMQEDQEVYGPSETFMLPEETSGPAIKRVNVGEGETWKYNGDSDFTIPGYYEYVDYREDGTARSYSRASLSDRLTTLYDEVERKVITMQEDQEVYGPTETFVTPEETSGPAIKRVNVKAGDTWEYYGGSDFVIPSYYDYVDYKEDGTARAYSAHSLSDKVTTLHGEVIRKVITMIKDQQIYGPSETFNVPIKIESPALDKITIAPSESMNFETPGITFDAPDDHSYQWYNGTDVIKSDDFVYSNRYLIEENDLKITNISDEDTLTLYGPYELFPTLRPRDNLHVKYNDGALSKLKVGNITITGQVEQNAANDQLYTVTGDISLNGFLKYRGELKVDKGKYTVSGNGMLYIPVEESNHFYAGQIPLYKGEFTIDAKTVNLMPGSVGKSLLSYEKLPIEINSVTIAPKGVNISGAIDFSPAFGGRVETSVQIDELSVRTDGMDLQGTFNLPDFSLGGLEITKPYVNLNTKAHAFGGGGEVGKIGKMIVPAGGSLSGDFNFYNGLLNRVAIQSVFSRPIPIGTTPFGLSGVGGGVDNIQGANKDYGTTIFVNADLSDTFSPTIDGGHLIMGDNLQLEASNLHVASSGSLKMYSLQLGKSRSEWHTKKGFNANGSMDIFDTYVADYSLKVPKAKPFNGSASGKLKVPDDIWFIGGKTFNGIKGDINPSKVMVSTTLIGIDVGVAYDFEKDDIKFKVSELEEEIQAQKIKDDVVVTYGTNMKAEGSYSSQSVMSTLASGLGVTIPIEEIEEAALMEVKWTGTNPDLTVHAPDGTEYPLVQTGDQANYLQEESSAFISVQNPQKGTWRISTDTEGTSDLSVQLVSVQQKPKVNSVQVDAEGERPVVSWDISGAEDTKVSLYISDSKNGYSGELLKENLPLAGEEVIELPETLISGKHYIFVKAEREDIGADWMYADQLVEYVDSLSPGIPAGLTDEGVNNGFIKLKWEAVEGVAGYVVAPIDENNQVDHSRGLQIEDGGTSAVIDGWATEKNYKLVVMSYKEGTDGELHYSLPSAPIDVYLPEPSPPHVDIEWKAEDGKVEEKKIELNDSIKTLHVSNSNEIELAVTLDQEAETLIMVNDKEVASPQGRSFSQIVQLEEGTNHITLQSVNEAGDETIQTYEMMVDTSVPTLYVESPFDQDILTTPEILVSGNSDIGSSVTVNGESVLLDEEGSFHYEYSVEDKETEQVMVKATDFAGNTTEYVAQLQMKIPEVKTDVTGTLIKGNEALPGVTFSVHSITGEEKWYDTTTNESGQFTMDLPDGEYQIDGVWLEAGQKWYTLNQTFSVVNGILKDQDELMIYLEDEPVSTDENIIGQITNKNQPVSEGVAFSIHTTGAEWYDVQTDVSGNFALYLPDGEYQIDGVWIESEQKWYVLNQLFTVSSGKLEGYENLIIDVDGIKPPPTEGIMGRVENMGTGMEDVLFSLHTTGENQQWYDVQTDVNGDFQLLLPDAEYQIDGIWVESEQKWYPLNQLFTVTGGQLEGETGLIVDLSIDIKQQGSVEGTVTKGSIGIPEVLFSLHTTDSNPVWRDVQTDESGRFSTVLLDGEYQIDGIWIQSESKWYPLNQVFSVVNGQLSGSVELTIDVLNEVVPSEGPITGKVTKTVTALGNVPFSLHTTDSSSVWYDAYADESGNFSLTLPNGEYQIDGIWMESEQTWYPLNQVFKVEQGLLVGAEEIVIDVLGELNQPAEPLTGKVVYGEQGLSEVIFSIHTREENPAWYDIQTDDSGEFTLNLSDGDYQIDGIWIESQSAWYVLNRQFTIENGRLKGLDNLIIDLTKVE